MPFVIDASVTLAWFFPDESSQYATQVILKMKTESALAPDIWPYEVANSLLTAERRNRLDVSAVSRIADEASRLPITVQHSPTSHTFDRILNVARDHNLTAYDAAYIDLAMREGLPLATLDDGLRAAAERVGVHVVA